MSDNLKKLTGKNPKDFESVAYSLINNSDVELFSELVSKEDFLFPPQLPLSLGKTPRSIL